MENQIQSILVGLLVAASFDRKLRLERAQERQRQVLRMAAEERHRKGKEQFDALLREISAWEQAVRIRRYVEACLATAGLQNGDAENAHKWAEWARALADGLDPIKALRESRADNA